MESTEDSEDVSQGKRTTLQAWGPPKSPLPPHRLAALANALGVSTPSPAMRPSISGKVSSSFPSRASSVSERSWASPTPSSTSTRQFSSYASASSSSRFLLHVMPPMHLPHDANSEESSELTPPPSNASGYHTQFRRGTLVPLFPTLQSQMTAIAKEYALPSTAGMILYLASAAPSRQPSPTPAGPEDDFVEPGPRLSEEIWKHLWTRVLRAEREDALVATHSLSPGYGLGVHMSKSSPYLPQDLNGQTGPLRPLFSPNPALQSQSSFYPITPSPSTPSTTSDLHRHNPQATSLSSRSQSDPDTPGTSTGSHVDDQESDPRADGLHLPGLNSTSMIPILAKVEFDIDRRRAGWYEPWLRSRKMNQLKRERKPALESDEKSAPIQLKLADRLAKDARKPFSTSPQQSEFDLPVSPSASTSASLSAVMEPPVVQIITNLPDRVQQLSSSPEPGLLSDAHRFSESPIAISPATPEPPRPDLSVVIPIQPLVPRPKSSPTTATMKKVPPPLSFDTGEAERDPNLPQFSVESPGMPLESPSMEMSDPRDLDQKRGGHVFDDLDLGLGDISVSYDDDDPNDRRKSQLLMKAKLDEIERTLAQFSPILLSKPLEDEPAKPRTRTASRPSGSPLKQDTSPGGPSPERSTSFKPIKHTVRIENARQGKAKLSEEMVVAAPGWHERSGSSAAQKEGKRDTLQPLRQTDPADVLSVWPAVPFSSKRESTQGGPKAPPRLALNGVTAVTPRASMVRAGSRESNDLLNSVFLGERSPQPSFVGPSRQDSVPIIPLSPDPFGRFPSQEELVRGPDKSESSSSTRPSLSEGRSSRFSADSVGDEAPKSGQSQKSGGLNAMKSVRNLWRKSKKGPTTPTSQPSSGRTSPNASPFPKNSQEYANPPPTPRSPLPPNMNMPPPPPGPPGPPGKHARLDSNVDHFHYDQDSPYPSRRSPQPPNSRPPSPPPAQGPDRSSIRKSILKGWKGGSLGGDSKSSSERRSDDKPERPPRPSGESNRQRRPSVLEFSAPVRPAPSPELPPPSPQFPYVQNGRVAGLSERRKSRPKMPSSAASTDLTSYGSAPQSMTSLASSRESSDTRPSTDTRRSFDAAQFEIVSPRSS